MSSLLLLENPVGRQVVVAACVYAFIVRLFRYDRAKRNVRTFRMLAAAKRARSSSKTINAVDKDKEAEKVEMDGYREILQSISTLEFPLFHRLALEFALFRTYTIPSISALLANTARFENNCGKRYDDTSLLFAELLENPFPSDRSVTALRRINFIHGQFRDKISNDDMVYVLSVFIFEPIRWIGRFEWRPLSREERDSLFIVWTHIGRRMGIQDIPKTLEEYEVWNQEYEKKYMVYAPSNVTVCEATVKLFLSQAPSFAHPFGRAVAYCLMDDRLRAALKYPHPNAFLTAALGGLLWIRKMILRFFMLPRPRWLSTRRSPAVGGIGQTMCPRYHLYAKTYEDGYVLARLGDAPPGKLTPADSYPVYTTKK